MYITFYHDKCIRLTRPADVTKYVVVMVGSSRPFELLGKFCARMFTFDISHTLLPNYLIVKIMWE